MTETELVKRAKKGDDEAFLSLIHLHKEALFRTAISYLKDENKALEAVQETTYRAYKSIRSLKKPEYFRTWLTRIIMNYCNDVLKKEKREITQDELQSMTGMEQDHTYLEVEEALNTLPIDLQELVRLKYFQDLKIREIADLWEAPEGTIKTKLHRALIALRRHFEEKGETKHV
ncbi:sigma-70 family RNA polymerase sigma factor [Chungangia koreensis]|uniref:sigma-70 family RNA polymerase sigma factor n=1 Tax=Chungangia koreensis TaxID=752657 RepID=UPI00366DA702